MKFCAAFERVPVLVPVIIYMNIYDIYYIIACLLHHSCHTPSQAFIVTSRQKRKNAHWPGQSHGRLQLTTQRAQVQCLWIVGPYSHIFTHIHTVAALAEQRLGFAA